MERQEIVARLAGLRRELEADKVLENDLTLALFLSDVCIALELSESEQVEVLGRKAAKQVEKWKQQVWWPTIEEETATPPLKELIAVSAV